MIRPFARWFRLCPSNGFGFESRIYFVEPSSRAECDDNMARPVLTAAPCLPLRGPKVLGRSAFILNLSFFSIRGCLSEPWASHSLAFFAAGKRVSRAYRSSRGFCRDVADFGFCGRRLASSVAPWSCRCHGLTESQAGAGHFPAPMDHMKFAPGRNLFEQPKGPKGEGAGFKPWRLI